MDAVFGPDNFRSEIIWRRSNAHNKLTKQYGPIHDTLLFYSKGKRFTFHPGRTPYTSTYVKKNFPYSDSHGKYDTLLFLFERQEVHVPSGSHSVHVYLCQEELPLLRQSRQVPVKRLDRIRNKGWGKRGAVAGIRPNTAWPSLGNTILDPFPD